MSVYDCPNCRDTGYYKAEPVNGYLRGPGLSDGGVTYTCTCSHGRKRSAENCRTFFPDYVLEEVAERNRRDRMKVEGKEMCWNCDIWHPAHEIKGHTCNNCYADPSYPRKLAMGLVK